MRYGAHSFIFTDRWSDGSLGILETARELGLDCLEIGVGDDVPFTPRRTRRQAEALGLQLAISPGGLWPPQCNLSSDDPDDRRQGLAWHKRQVELGAEMGAVAYAGAIYGYPGAVQRRIPPRGEQERLAELLHQLAAHGAHHGILIALEPMSHFRTHVANTPEQIVRLVTLADHANLTILIDTYHMITEVRDYSAAIHAVRERLWGIHACENDRGVPGGGLVPWGSIFTALHDIAFDGYVIMESYNSSIGDFAYRRGMFHNVCPDGTQFVRQGLRFLQGGLERDRKQSWCSTCLPKDSTLG